MQAFKAANSAGSLEDFVRWHSPRDWVTEEGLSNDVKNMKGILSGRMQQPGNLWLQIWEESTAVPISRQRSLFDYTTHAEKVRRKEVLLEILLQHCSRLFNCNRISNCL
jgi:Rab3 GTPase-activating protein catalytic subunit